MVGGLAVGDGDEPLDPAGAGVFHREELLVFLHRGLQHLGRQAEEGFANRAHQGDGPFDQARDLGQKPCVFDDFEALGEGHGGGVMPDLGGALCRVEEDASRFQFAA